MANLNHQETSSDDFFYDVFLSFRGEDGDGRFTDHLFTALRQKGINTFRHDKELKFGAPELIRPDILKAIRNSRMLIVVLSQNYASSTCCLDELAEIVDSYDKKGSQVLIIFYKVEPSDVWDLKNTYADAMAEHEISFEKDLEKVKTWRTALSRVRELSREYCSDTKSNSISGAASSVSVSGALFDTPGLDLSLPPFKAFVKQIVQAFLEEKQQQLDEEQQEQQGVTQDKEFDDDGDLIICKLSEKRKVTIQDFRGKTLVSIREYYRKDGKDLPTSKGLFTKKYRSFSFYTDHASNDFATKKVKLYTGSVLFVSWVFCFYNVGWTGNISHFHCTQSC
ncbi:disease resistance protein RLM3-like isoform X3 [Lotus japonicus]|uniref:disease resistance protein RLM3-like isoform X3 n=1 Tax=Lotus japonicus TaxID=34305 RepID=UPI0025905CC4|nr:disease resistance protein RLM3-like isoform X3 [Lotus japonicus]